MKTIRWNVLALAIISSAVAGFVLVNIAQLGLEAAAIVAIVAAVIAYVLGANSAAINALLSPESPPPTMTEATALAVVQEFRLFAEALVLESDAVIPIHEPLDGSASDV